MLRVFVNRVLESNLAGSTWRLEGRVIGNAESVQKPRLKLPE
jgi:hypothetical protein